MTAIAPTQLHGLDNFDLLDVRSPGEFADVHAPGAMLLPLDKLDPQAVRELRKHDGPLYVMCRSGARSRSACERLNAAGIEAVNIQGGIIAWEKAGLPVVRSGTPRALLGRYARAGALIVMLASLILAWLVQPAFLLGAAGAWIGMTLMGQCPLMVMLGSGRACSIGRDTAQR
jgi:rhodanese-related sulfurtransferase